MRKVLVGVCPSDRHTPQGVSHGTKPGRRPPDRTAGLHRPRQAGGLRQRLLRLRGRLLTNDHDGYYDDFYGPIDDGYWEGDFFFYGDGHGHYHRDEAHHFRRDAATGFHAFHAHGPAGHDGGHDGHDH